MKFKMTIFGMLLILILILIYGVFSVYGDGRQYVEIYNQSFNVDSRDYVIEINFHADSDSIISGEIGYSELIVSSKKLGEMYLQARLHSGEMNENFRVVEKDVGEFLITDDYQSWQLDYVKGHLPFWSIQINSDK